MLSLRRSLFDRLLHLPLPKLWDMKTGGILSRLTGDVDTTTGLLQMAVVSPAISVIRLVDRRRRAAGAELAAGADGAGHHPRRDADELRLRAARPADLPLGAQGRRSRSTAASARRSPGIRVVRAFGREMRELLDYMLGRHTVLRKELFAHRRELVLWTSWGLLLGGGQRGDRLVRRLPERRRAAPRSATSWRSSGTRSCC